jgi:hypothetical protein
VDLSRESYLLGAGLRAASTLLTHPNPARRATVGQLLWTVGLPAAAAGELPGWASQRWTKPAAAGGSAHSSDACGGVLVEGDCEQQVLERVTSLG